MINTKNQKGVTLIEIIVVSTILVLLAGTVLGLQYILTQNREVTVRNFLNVDQANINLEIIEKELRTARLSENGSYPLISANDNELVFYSDADFDGVVERIRYTRTGTQLVRGIIEPTGQPLTYSQLNESVKTLTTNVRNDTTPLFLYYNGDWPLDTTNNPLDTPATLSDVRSVRVYIVVNENENSPDSDYVLDSVITIRMLKDNL